MKFYLVFFGSFRGPHDKNLKNIIKVFFLGSLKKIKNLISVFIRFFMGIFDQNLKTTILVFFRNSFDKNLKNFINIFEVFLRNPS